MTDSPRGSRAPGHTLVTRVGRRRRRPIVAVTAIAVALVTVVSLGTSAPPVAAEPDIDEGNLVEAAERAREQLSELEGQQDLTRVALIELEAKMVALESELAAAQSEWVAATEKLETASARADRQLAGAKKAQAAADEADAELVASLRRMYVRPPRNDQAAVMGATNLEDQMQVQAILSTQSSQRHTLLKRAESARQLADARYDAAETARRTAEREERRAEDAAAALDAARTELNDEMTYAATLLGALDDQHADLTAEATELATRAAMQHAARDVYTDEASIVNVPGTTIRVHPAIGANAIALVEAARLDGLALDGWGWRSTQRQIELRAAHCGADPVSIFEKSSSACSPPTARPGRSMHERGLAIDFKNCSTRSTACYKWLAENAALYGFYNLPSEPWHWSINGN